MIEVTFERDPLEDLENMIATNGKISARECLERVENLPRGMADVVLFKLAKQWEKIDFSDLPRYEQIEATARRAKLEEKLLKSGQLKTGLDENDLLRVYLEELEEFSRMGDLKTLLAQYKTGDTEMAEKIVQLSLDRVVEMACDKFGYGLLIEDLIQEGGVGLWRGVLEYVGGDYEAHIRHWIGWYMTAALLQQAHLDGVLDKVRRGLVDFRDADLQLLYDLGRNPTMEEIAETMHISVEEADTYAAMFSQANTKEQLERARTPKEETPDDNHAVEDTAYFQTRQRIMEMLSTLTEQEVKLLTLRFGLEGGLPMDPQQAGQALGLTADEVIKMETTALLKLRQNAD